MWGILGKGTHISIFNFLWRFKPNRISCFLSLPNACPHTFVVSSIWNMSSTPQHLPYLNGTLSFRDGIKYHLLHEAFLISTPSPSGLYLLWRASAHSIYSFLIKIYGIIFPKHFLSSLLEQGPHLVHLSFFPVFYSIHICCASILC